MDCVHNARPTMSVATVWVDRPEAGHPLLGRCVACNVAQGTTAPGCPDNRPICGADDRTCHACDVDEYPCQAPKPYCQRLSGECYSCDPATSNGCILNSDNPICDDGQCRSCRAGVDVCPNDRFCVDGGCVVCVPGTNEGCSNNGPGGPICDIQSQACRECRLGECGNDLTCVNGRCRVCNPETNFGCSAETPICVDGQRCESCSVADNNCNGVWAEMGPLCVRGRCSVCDPSTNAGCDVPTPLCNLEYQCDVECNADFDCVDGVCEAGLCQRCRPGTNEGCPLNFSNRQCSPELSVLNVCRHRTAMSMPAPKPARRSAIHKRKSVNDV